MLSINKSISASLVLESPNLFWQLRNKERSCSQLELFSDFEPPLFKRLFKLKPRYAKSFWWASGERFAQLANRQSNSRSCGRSKEDP